MTGNHDAALALTLAIFSPYIIAAILVLILLVWEWATNG